MKTDNLIDIRNINFSYPGNSLFKDFSLSFNKSEIVAILGNSGCGKSTLLNLIAGVLKPDSGTIEVNESFVFLTQRLTVLPYHNAYENTLLACELRKTMTEQKAKEADDLFALFKLSENSKSKFPHELSGGMRQRVGLIQTLLVDAPICFLDEPLKEIDRATGQIIQNYIWRKFKTNNVLGLFITHDMEHAVSVSDKILFLSANRQAEKIAFDEEFTSLPPNERVKTDAYNEYMLYGIKKLVEM